MGMDRDRLLRLAEEARREAALVETRQRQAEAAAQQSARQIGENESARRAHEIIRMIPLLAEEAARKGHMDARVMKLMPSDLDIRDFDHFLLWRDSQYLLDYDRVSPAFLRGAGQLVYEYCERENLRPWLSFKRAQFSDDIIRSFNDHVVQGARKGEPAKLVV